MMRKKNFQFLYALVLLVPILLVTGTALSTSTVTAETEEIEQQTSDPYYELVQGYFTEISYSGSESETSVELAHEDFTYSWQYSDDQWTGDTDYLDEDNTTFSEGEWTLSIAVDHNAPLGSDWTITTDGDEHSVQVVEADPGMAKSGSLNFMLDPYTEEQVVSDSFRLINTGNVPGTFKLDYEHIDNLYSVVDRKTIDPGDSASITFNYEYDATDPTEFNLEKFTVETYSEGRLDLDAEGNVVIDSIIAYGETPSVTVGYPGYQRIIRDDFAVLYEDSINVDGDTHNEITFYVYPHDVIFSQLRKENVFFDEGEDVTMTVLEGFGEEEERTEQTFSSPQQLDPHMNEVELNVEFRSHHMEDGQIELAIEGERIITEVNILQVAPDPEENDEDDGFLCGAIFLPSLLVVTLAIYQKKEMGSKK